MSLVFGSCGVLTQTVQIISAQIGLARNSARVSTRSDFTSACGRVKTFGGGGLNAVPRPSPPDRSHESASEFLVVLALTAQQRTLVTIPSKLAISKTDPLQVSS